MRDIKKISDNKKDTTNKKDIKDIKNNLTDQDIKRLIIKINDYWLKTKDTDDQNLGFVSDWFYDQDQDSQKYKDLYKRYIDNKGFYMGLTDTDHFIGHIVIMLESKNILTIKDINELKSLNIIDKIF